MFDELLNPPPSVVHQAPKVIALIDDVIPPIQDDSTSSPSSTTVHQDAPSARNDSLLGVSITEVTSAQSSSTISPHQIVIIKFMKMIQGRVKVPVRRIRTDNETEFVNQTLCEYYEEVGISHETSVARSPQQNGVIERQNRTLIEAARTMLIYAQASLFLWAEAVATACYTKNRSIIRLRHEKTPYELLHNKLPDLSFLHVFGSLCYPTNDMDTPMVEKSKLDEDKEGKPLIYHIIMARPTKKHVHAVKRIFRYLRGTVHRGLWYPKDSSVALTAFADADHAGCEDTRRSTSGSVQFLRERLIS
nr:putative ribonuclease H-like domain-containing protein [Tanacetum cinerariifolium]